MIKKSVVLLISGAVILATGENDSGMPDKWVKNVEESFEGQKNASLWVGEATTTTLPKDIGALMELEEEKQILEKTNVVLPEKKVVKKITKKKEKLSNDITKKILKKIKQVPPGSNYGPITSELYLKLTDGQHGEQALRLIREWEDNGAPPELTRNGDLQYTIGKGTPLVLVKPAHLSNIKFQKGELIKDILLGDPTRWEVLDTYVGRGVNKQAHLIIKALEADSTTTLFVATNLRLYRIQLASSAVFDTPSVSFKLARNIEIETSSKNKRLIPQSPIENPTESPTLKRVIPELPLKKATPKKSNKELELEEKNLKLEAELKKIENKLATSEFENQVIDNTKNLYLDHSQLDFNYNIKTKGLLKRDPIWMPEQVFNDGVRTYIVMPNITKVTYAPVLLHRLEGVNELINYRLVGNRYIVDHLFLEAVLISGVGRRKQEVRIIYGNN